MEPVTPKLTVDSIIIREDSILLIKRLNPPFKGMWALPGGFVDVGETVENAVLRETLEETGLEVEIESILGVYSDPKRDPRGHSVSVCYMCRITGGKLSADTDALDARFYKLNELPELAFDHGKIIEDVKRFLKNRRK